VINEHAHTSESVFATVLNVYTLSVRTSTVTAIAWLSFTRSCHRSVDRVWWRLFFIYRIVHDDIFPFCAILYLCSIELIVLLLHQVSVNIHFYYFYNFTAFVYHYFNYPSVSHFGEYFTSTTHITTNRHYK
jgi:hypothetical protein